MKLDPSKKIAADYKILDNNSGRYVSPGERPRGRSQAPVVAADPIDTLIMKGFGMLFKAMLRELK